MARFAGLGLGREPGKGEKRLRPLLKAASTGWLTLRTFVSAEPSTGPLPPAAITPEGAAWFDARLAASDARCSTTATVPTAAAPCRPSRPISFRAFRRDTTRLGIRASALDALASFEGFAGGW